MAQWTDQRAHDVMWMTAQERNDMDYCAEDRVADGTDRRPRRTATVRTTDTEALDHIAMVLVAGDPDHTYTLQLVAEWVRATGRMS